MYRKLMFVMSFIVVLGLVSSASAACTWLGGTSSDWTDAANWDTPCVGGEKCLINAGEPWDPVIPPVMGGGPVYANEVLVGYGGGIGNLTVLGGGGLEIPAADWAAIYIAVGEDSKGTLTILSNATVTTPKLVVGNGGDGMLVMAGGTLTVTDYWFHFDTGHVELYGGLIELKHLWAPDEKGGTMHIGEGVMKVVTGASPDGWSVADDVKKYVEKGLFTGYNLDYTMTDWDEKLNSVAWKYDEPTGTTTIWAVPEPATVMLLGLGGLALIRRKR